MNPPDAKAPSGNSTGPTDGPAVPAAEVQAALKKLVAAWKVEVATFTKSRLISPPLLPGEACEGCTVAICCDSDPFKAPAGKIPTCDCNGKPYAARQGPK